MKKYSNDISVSECNNIRIDNFFKDVAEKATFLTDYPIITDKDDTRVTLFQE
jgi:hypothetical protein